MYTINTPKVEKCIESVMARHRGTSERALGKYFEEVHQYLAPLARDLERENFMLRQGDTCARQCEGTAYRIEVRRLRAALARLAAAVGELPENGSGTVQGAELNAAYTGAMTLLTPNEGSLRTKKWQDKDGQDRYTTEIRADKMVMLGGTGERSSEPQKQPEKKPAPAGGFADMDNDVPFMRHGFGAAWRVI